MVRASSRLSRMGRQLLAAVSGGAVMMTLMACYGMTHRHAPMPYPSATHCPDGQMDQDGDGVCTPEDCDDRARHVHPGAGDIEGDDIDSNCDGVDGTAETPGVAAPDPDQPASSRSQPPTVTPLAAPTGEAPKRPPQPMVAPTPSPAPQR